MALEVAVDCRNYLGDRPCKFGQRCRCEHYDRMDMRILIIKTGALGDVVRTVCLLPTLKRRYPNSQITWVTKPNGVRILSGHPLIDRLLAFDSEGILVLTQEQFDLVISLDKEAGPTSLCNAVRCPDKRGIGTSAWGTPIPCNFAAERYFELGLDNDLKFKRNFHTYPELIHSALELEYVREPYRLYCDSTSLQRARQMFQPWRVGNHPVIGLNTGAGSVFANKVPKPARWVELAKSLLARRFTVVLTGGPDEVQVNEWIMEQVGPEIHSIGNHHTEQQFVALIDQCDTLVTGDTLALHVALSRDVPVVAMFGPTCEQEIDLFGLGKKIMAPCGCGPCYKRQCDCKPNCMDLIPTEQIMAAVVAVCDMPQRRLLPVS